MTGLKVYGRSEISIWIGFDEMSNGHHIYLPGKCLVSIEWLIKSDTDTDTFFLNSVPLKDY